jgi:hypothetical protein
MRLWRRAICARRPRSWRPQAPRWLFSVFSWLVFLPFVFAVFIPNLRRARFHVQNLAKKAIAPLTESRQNIQNK